MSDDHSTHSPRPRRPLMSRPRRASRARGPLVGIARGLAATGLAAPAHLDLGLDHDRVPDGLGLGDGLLHRVGHAAGRRGNAEPGEVLLALVLVEIHRNCSSSVTGWDVATWGAGLGGRAGLSS